MKEFGNPWNGKNSTEIGMKNGITIFLNGTVENLRKWKLEELLMHG